MKGHCKKNVSYTLVCACGASMEVVKLEEGKKNGWVLREIYKSSPTEEFERTEPVCPTCVEEERQRQYNSADLRERIQGGYYADHLDEFRKDALDYVGLLDHPKADKAYSQAWNRASSDGYNNVLCELEEIANLLK